MATESAVDTTRDEYLLAQVREAFGRVVYSHKTHEKQADICFGRYRWQQGILVAFTAISTGTFLASVLGLLGNPVLTSLVTSANSPGGQRAEPRLEELQVQGGV